MFVVNVSMVFGNSSSTKIPTHITCHTNLVSHTHTLPLLLSSSSSMILRVGPCIDVYINTYAHETNETEKTY